MKKPFEILVRILLTTPFYPLAFWIMKKGAGTDNLGLFGIYGTRKYFFLKLFSNYNLIVVYLQGGKRIEVLSKTIKYGDSLFDDKWFDLRYYRVTDTFFVEIKKGDNKHD